MAEVLDISLGEVDRLIDGRAPDMDTHVVAADLTHYESLVRGAERLSQVETVAIPGLLQTREYALGVERFGALARTGEERMHEVERRLSRQLVLHRSKAPLILEAVVVEHVLTNVVGDHDVMADQCDHLLELAERPNIDLRVLPADGRQVQARGGFQLFSRANSVHPFLVAEFSPAGPSYEERPAMIDTFERIYRYLRSVSLTSTESIRLIRDVREVNT